jgi:hypothetical protein
MGQTAFAGGHFNGAARVAPAAALGRCLVLTRLALALAGVATGCQIPGQVQVDLLQRRLRPLDVTIFSEISAATTQLDPGAHAWLSPSDPLKFLVTGSSSRPAPVSLTLRLTAPSPRSGADVAAHSSHSVLRLCLRVQATCPVRSAGVSASFTPATARVAGSYHVAQRARGDWH